MSEEDKKDAEENKNRLRSAFGEDPFSTYEKFSPKRWNGESVDVYATELSRLASFVGRMSEKALKRAFAVGLPKVISRELIEIPEIERIEMLDLIERSRALLAVEKKSYLAIAELNFL